jgi:hypothetical protein
MLIERRLPVLGEVHELEEAEQARAGHKRARFRRALLMVFAGACRHGLRRCSSRRCDAVPM